MLEINFNDLNKDAQKKVLDFYGYENEREGNLDTQPLFILERDEELDDISEDKAIDDFIEKSDMPQDNSKDNNEPYGVD